MSLTIRDESGPPGLGAARLARLARFGRRVLAATGRRGWEVSVLVVDDPAIRALNKAWRRLDRATDVLSFPAGEGPGPARLLGDVAISAPRAAEQAARFGVTLDGELKRLLVHGILHLMGFDHQTRPERREMRAAEERLLSLRGRAAPGSRTRPRLSPRTRA